MTSSLLRIVSLLLPAIIPSWRFFDVIAPSPRIQFVLLTSKDSAASRHQDWREFRPRPAHVSFLQMLGHMLWNPMRNETLFLVSCAERLLQQYTQHSEDEILKRIVRDLGVEAGHLQFRLLLVKRDGDQLQQTVAFHSRIQSLPLQNM